MYRRIRIVSLPLDTLDRFPGCLHSDWFRLLLIFKIELPLNHLRLTVLILVLLILGFVLLIIQLIRQKLADLQYIGIALLLLHIHETFHELLLVVLNDLRFLSQRIKDSVALHAYHIICLVHGLVDLHQHLICINDRCRIYLVGRSERLPVLLAKALDIAVHKERAWLCKPDPGCGLLGLCDDLIGLLLCLLDDLASLVCDLMICLEFQIYSSLELLNDLKNLFLVDQYLTCCKWNVLSISNYILYSI